MIYLLYTLLILTNTILFFMVNKKGYLLISLPAVLYTASSLYAFWGVIVFDFASTVPFELFEHSNENLIEISVVYFLACSVAYLLGVSILGKSNFSRNEKNREYSIPMSQGSLIFLSLLWISIYIPSYGMGNIIERDVYIPEFTFRIGVIISTLILPVSSFCLGYIKNPVFRRLMFIIYIAILIMTSSRAIVVFIFLYYVGGVIRTGRFSIIKFILASALSFWFTAFALFARYQHIQGLQNIYNFFSWYDLANLQLSINYLFSFSIGVLSYAQTVGLPVSLQEVILYLNPLPSSLIDFKEHDNLIGAAPYSAISLLYLFSPFFGMIYFLLAGWCFGKMYRGAYSSFIYSKLFVCLSLIFAFMSLQYTLRASTRLLYYSVFAYCIFLILRKILNKIKF